MHLNRHSQFEGFTFRPWMGYLAAAFLMVVAWDRDDSPSIIARGLGLTCFFTTNYVIERRRKERGAGSSVWEMRSFLFAIFCALLTLSFVIAYLLDLWAYWGG